MPTRTPEITNEAPSTRNAGASPSRATSSAPMTGPVMTASWNVTDTSALAATSRLSGTTFGIDAWRLGWNRAAKIPKTAATT